MQNDITTEQPEDKRRDPEAIRASNLFDASTYLLITLNAPEQVRRLFPALIGMLAGRKYRVRFSRLELGRRLFADHGGYLNENECSRIEQRVTGYLSQMQDWIHREGLNELIEYTPGTKTEKGAIKTPILQWIIELAEITGARLHPDAPDKERRLCFRQASRTLLKEKGYRSKQQRKGGERSRRQPEPHTLLKTAKSLLKNFLAAKSAKSEDELTQAKRHILNEIETFLECLCIENLSEEKGTRGGANPENTPQRQEHRCGINSVQPEPPDMTNNVIATRTEEGTPPPCVPSSSVPFSDASRAMLAVTAGRSGDHWQALHVAASVGAVPTSRVLGGRGDADGKQEPRNIEQPSEFITEFEELVSRSTPERSLVLVLSDCVFHRDDCTQADVDRIGRYAWMVTETSSGSFQCWFRMSSGTRADFHALLTRGGIGGNTGGTSSGRWPGAYNGKPHHHGWRVRLAGCQPGRLVTLAEVSSDLGIEIESRDGTSKTHTPPSRTTQRTGRPQRWPDYRMSTAGKLSRSEADAAWYVTCAKWHWTAEEIAEQARTVSPRAAAMEPRRVLADVRRVLGKYQTGCQV